MRTASALPALHRAPACEVYGLERVEVLKGPASALCGAGMPWLPEAGAPPAAARKIETRKMS